MIYVSFVITLKPRAIAVSTGMVLSVTKPTGNSCSGTGLTSLDDSRAAYH